MARGARLVCGLLVAALAGAAQAQSKPPALDKTFAKKISALGERWWKARPRTRFVEWDPKQRAALEAEARALGEIPEGTMAAVVDLLWANAKKLGPKGTVAKGKITLETPYGDAWCHLVGSGKDQALLVGLHGGGEGAGSADESRSTWQQKKGCIGLYPQGIKLVHDTWNAVHGERFVLTLIEIAKTQYEIDPDRVYVAGFSMGGSGSWYLAGRHPDLFAGAAPFSGVVMASPRSQLATKEEVQAIQHGLLPNVRNLAMWYTIGLADENCMPGSYLYVADVLDKLRAGDPTGWSRIHFQTYPGLGHAFPPGEPETGLKSLFGQERDTFPSVLVWEYARNPSPEPDAADPVGRMPKRFFYWLGCKEPQDQQRVRATRTQNEFVLECRNTAREFHGITLYLNPGLIDAAQDVVVKSNGQEVFRGKPKPDVWTVLETLDEKLDRSLVFDRRIDL